MNSVGEASHNIGEPRGVVVGQESQGSRSESTGQEKIGRQFPETYHGVFEAEVFSTIGATTTDGSR